MFPKFWDLLPIVVGCVLLVSASTAQAGVGMGKRIISTRYGNVQGVLKEFQPHTKLKPVEAFYGLQFSTTLGFRYMPPSSPLEHWLGLRLALIYRDVCPQPLINERALTHKYPKHRVEHLKKLAAYVSTQTEDCLKLNLYVPVIVRRTT
ncbi:neuroligin-4, Y-linked-like [Mizuhopecten yessoensis]|uniref:neuroligin-4, Y-linked-like n=1 Tax=Mizuhopecten yessoensis TaxID=6573 RepID=UPI000B45C150|nr:neuroligin-4, Y-linked-like [Mizuhopecten yessoensis]